MCDTSLAHTGLVMLADLPGVPESGLSDSMIGQLPAGTPGPPWDCRIEATVWWHRATLSGQALLPPGLPAGPKVTVGAFITYLDTPVGPYSEVLASPRLLAGAVRRGVLARVHVPFIAVDSLTSIQGGRSHWSLPKTLATFSGGALDRQVRGNGWRVRATARPAGPWLPSVIRLGSTQVDGAGAVSSSVTRSMSRSRLARVVVETESTGDLARWLLPGTHRGLVLRGRMTVGSASPG